MDNRKYSRLIEKIKNCRRCPLYLNTKNAVPGEGSLGPKVMFIGEAPGRKEDEIGRPFVGAAGKLLDSMLASIGLNREEVFITSIIKHRPPENRDPKPEEIAACAGYLEEQIALLQPPIIVTLGRHALNFFFPELKISAAHGQPQKLAAKGQKSNPSPTLLPFYHPASALYDPKLRSVLMEDMKILQKMLKNEIKKA